jgi:ribosomal-protein-alanine N-acetyltransferase
LAGRNSSVSDVVPEVLAIEAAGDPHPWPEDEFLKNLRRRNCIGMVAEVGDAVAGFMVYDLHRGHIDVIRLAVAPAFRRKGVGRAMVGKLRGKLSAHRRTFFELRARETNLDGQLFLKRVGLAAMCVERGRYADSGEDAYRFVLAVDADEPAPAERCVGR